MRVSRRGADAKTLVQGLEQEWVEPTCSPVEVPMAGAAVVVPEDPKVSLAR